MSRLVLTIASVVFLTLTFPTFAQQGDLPGNIPQGGMPQDMPGGMSPGGMPQGMPGNMQRNQPSGPMNQPGGMRMPGNQARGGMSQQQAQRDNEGWRGPGQGYGHYKHKHHKREHH